MSRRRKLGRKAVVALVGVEILAALAVALASHSSSPTSRKSSRGNSGMFEQTVGGSLSAPSLAVF